MKIRIDPLDKLFSLYIRTRDRGICQRCLANKGIEGVQCCHFHSRSRRSVRWDEDNACALCFGCHSYLDSHPLEKVEFWKQRLGEDKFDLLNSRMRQITKPDKVLIELYLKAKLEELK